jgi:hypothetical protein
MMERTFIHDKYNRDEHHYFEQVIPMADGRYEHLSVRCMRLSDLRLSNGKILTSTGSDGITGVSCGHDPVFPSAAIGISSFF